MKPRTVWNKVGKYLNSYLRILLFVILSPFILVLLLGFTLEVLISRVFNKESILNDNKKLEELPVYYLGLILWLMTISFVSGIYLF